MHADGSGQRRLTCNSASDDSPAWSIDGNQIAFNSARDGNGEIYVMSINGAQQKNLTKNSASFGGPVWKR